MGPRIGEKEAGWKNWMLCGFAEGTSEGNRRSIIKNVRGRCELGLRDAAMRATFI